MSYQVLARKYRPKNFETLVGQEHVVRALTHALASRRLHHAYLFTGTRGVGKTTLSRILAKSFNCVGPDGNGDITAQPCGVCDACTAIDAGRFVDYIEMDAASNRGVDEMAALLEQAVYSPSNARFKVYMIDEVHMLTNHAFNSMLKTLEEPPEHVKFILATTDPQKIPMTVLSRCLQFNLKQMPPGHIISHLNNILGQEDIAFEQPALRLLAQGAHGSMRDALSLTDQAIAYAAGEVTLAAVQGMLGALDQSYLIRLLDALGNENGADLLAIADEMAARSLSYNAALQDLGSLLHRIAMAQSVPKALPDDLPEREEIMRLAGVFDAEEVQLFYQIAVHGRNELGLAPDEYAGFSMTLLRMLAFRPGNIGAGDAPVGGNSGNGSGGQKALAGASPRAAAPAQAAQQTASAATTANTASTASTITPARPGISPGRAALEAARGIAPASGSVRGQTSASAAVSAYSAPAPAPAPAYVAAAPAPAHVAPAPVATANQSAMPESSPPWEMDAAALAQFDDGGHDFFGATAQKKTELRLVDLASNAESTQSFADSSASNSAGNPVANPTINASTSAALRVAANIAAKAAAKAEALALNGDGSNNPIMPEVIETAPPVAQAIPPFVPQPVPGLEWDGDWPTLAADLPVRGVALQLSLQSELVLCEHGVDGTQFLLRTPLMTLCAAANVEKLAAALGERFAQFARTVQVKTEVGQVWHTAHVRAEAARAVLQAKAEQQIQNDPFVQKMMREFGAIVVPGSIRPSVARPSVANQLN